MRRRRMRVLEDIPGRLVRTDRLPGGNIALTFKLNDKSRPPQEQPRSYEEGQRVLNDKLRAAFMGDA